MPGTFLLTTGAWSVGLGPERVAALVDPMAGDAFWLPQVGGDPVKESDSAMIPPGGVFKGSSCWFFGCFLGNTLISHDLTDV